MSGKKSPSWKGDDVKYVTKHRRIQVLKGKANDYKCIDCDKMAEDWSNKNHLYSDNPDDYMPCCRKCYCKYNKEFNNVKQDEKMR